MAAQPSLPWITEATSHIGLSEIKGIKHHPTIVKWLEDLKSGWREDETPWCLEGDIEVLTADGFIRFDKLKESKPSAVAQLNRVTGQVEFVKQFEYIEKDYEGIVYDVERKGLNFTCDPKHRLYGAFDGGRKLGLREISKISKFGAEVPRIKSSQMDAPITIQSLMFMAAFLSDGTYQDNSKHIRFKFSKERKIELMEKFPYLSKQVDTKVYGVSNYPYTNFKFDKSLLKTEFLSEYKLMRWKFVRSLSSEQCKIFIDAYANFDGTISENGSYEVYTSDPRLQEQLNYIATMAGYKSTPFKVKQVSANSKIEYLYHVYISRNKYRSIQKKHITEREFKGKLYCISVPSSVMIIRCRKGTIIPIGNCGTFVAHCLQTAGLKRGTVNSRLGWDGKSKSPAGYYPFNWYGALDYSREGGTKLTKPAYGCVAVKTRKGGGHVTFIVGRDKASGKLVGLGGNQSDKVCYALYDQSEFSGFYWYGTQATPAAIRYDLPILTGVKATKVSEA